MLGVGTISRDKIWRTQISNRKEPPPAILNSIWKFGGQLACLRNVATPKCKINLIEFIQSKCFNWNDKKLILILI